MKKIIYLTALCTLMGCGSAKHTQVAKQVSSDSTFIQKMHYDSIYIYHDRYMKWRTFSKEKTQRKLHFIRKSLSLYKLSRKTIE